MTKYSVEIIQMGSEVYTMLQNQMIVLFNDDAPDELRSYCIITSQNEIKGTVKAGDTIKIEDKYFTITAVGDIVNENLFSMGHVTLNFDGQNTPQLPGQIHLSPAFEGSLLGSGKIKIE